MCSMILDLNKPFCELGNQPAGQADFVFQKGVVFNWSESNMRYEEAWWLYNAAPSPLVEALIKNRPFPGMDNIKIAPDQPGSHWKEPFGRRKRVRKCIDFTFSLNDKG